MVFQDKINGSKKSEINKTFTIGNIKQFKKDINCVHNFQQH